MRAFILQKVRDAAVVLGLDAANVFEKSKKDNITLARPRVELDFCRKLIKETGGCWVFQNAKLKKRL